MHAKIREPFLFPAIMKFIEVTVPVKLYVSTVPASYLCHLFIRAYLRNLRQVFC
jgi:hypothetical protein